MFKDTLRILPLDITIDLYTLHLFVVLGALLSTTVSTTRFIIPFNQFDDSCWSIRSQLDNFPLDTCSEPISKKSVVVGVYNSYFLFDGIRDPRAQSVWDGPIAAERHLDRIVEVLRRNNPDIIGLCEVENQAILERLANEMAPPTYTPYFVQGRDTFTGQDVALLTQGIESVNQTRTDCRSGMVPGSRCRATYSRTNGVSKNMIALFDSCLFGRKFAVIVVHFYAFPTSRQRCVRREMQARVIQDAMQQLITAGFEVMVMGDINDYSDIYATPFGGKPISRVLSMLRDPDGDGVDELQNVMQRLPIRDRYTSWWDRDDDDAFDIANEATMIDHILMTHYLYERVTDVWIDHGYTSKLVSDHWPIFVEMSAVQMNETR